MKRSQTEEREGKELRRGGGGDGGAWGREEKRRIVAYVATTLFTRLLLRKQLRVLCRYFSPQILQRPFFIFLFPVDGNVVVFTLCI